MKKLFLKWLFTFTFCIGLVISNQACTIFVLTDSKRTLFFNNEDFSNPATRIWFLPGANNFYGVAYVGFDNDWAQGGVNTAGLAFDWVAGYDNDYTPSGDLKPVRGNNPSQRMLETCATVEEAIAFYQKYKEPAFSNARLMIADRTGASVVIGGRNGQLYFDTSHQSRGFGYGEKKLHQLLDEFPKPTLKNGLPILQACHQQGQFATKYSSIYDLRSGDIFLLPAGQKNEIKINLIKELAKGGHYYDMPNIDKQRDQALKPLNLPMKRFIADGYTPLADPDSALDNRFKSLLENIASGNLNESAFSVELWHQLTSNLKNIQHEREQLGKLQSLQLVEKNETNYQYSYLYLIEFDHATILQRFGINEKGKLSTIKSEGYEQK